MSENVFEPEKRRPYFLVRVWVVWTAIMLLSYVRHSIEGTHPFGWPNGSLQEFISWFPCFYPWAILTPAIFRVEERYPLSLKQWKTRVPGAVLASLGFSCAALLLGRAMDFFIDLAFGKLHAIDASLWQIERWEFYFQQFGFWSTWGAAWALRTFAQYHRQAQKAAQLALEKSQLEASLQRAELENLRMRLNPHFLFNTLQNISVLTQQNPKLATQMLTRLGDLLRTALRRDASAETTLQEELALTKDYLAVEKMRLGDRLTILEDVEAGTERALIPSFVLQPLVENAVIHGLRGATQAGTIVMQARRENGRLVLTIADNGRGIPEDWRNGVKVGVGLSSTEERLTRMYPGEQEFQIRRLAEGGTEVRIAIPFRVNEEIEENVAHEPSIVGRG
jgi:two-component system, LytTR family, sensor kinase